VRAAAAARLADEAIATRASLSRGMAGARAIAEKHGTETNAGTQTDLTEF
jgi:deoxyribodipyrimidine photo-lyase